MHLTTIIEYSVIHTYYSYNVNCANHISLSTDMIYLAVFEQGVPGGKCHTFIKMVLGWQVPAWKIIVDIMALLCNQSMYKFLFQISFLSLENQRWKKEQTCKTTW